MIPNENHPGPPVAGLRHARSFASFRSRIAPLALLIASIGMSVLLASLLLTEDGLPARTAAALAVLLVIALAWAGYAVWVLTARRGMPANHQVVAGWISLVAALVFTMGAVAMEATSRPAAARPAIGFGVILTFAAGVQLVRARRRYAALQARRADLEARLAAAGRGASA